MNWLVLICHETLSVFVSTSSFDFFKYLLNSIGFTSRLTRIKENTKVTKRALYSYSVGRESTKATHIPPLNPPYMRTFCHLAGILTCAIRNNRVSSKNQDYPCQHYYTNWS